MTHNWESQLPGTGLITDDTHYSIITTGAADRSSSSDCGLRPLHTHSHLVIPEVFHGGFANTGNPENNPWVLFEDSLPKDKLQYPDLGKNPGILVDEGRIYKYISFGRTTGEGGTNPQSHGVQGHLYVPWAAILDSSYSKRYTYGLGADHAGDDYDSPTHWGFDAARRGIGGGARRGLASIDVPFFGPASISADFSTLQDADPLNPSVIFGDARVQMRLPNPGLGPPILFDLGLSYRQYVNGGVAIQVDHRQTSIAKNDRGDYVIGSEFTFTCLTTGRSTTINNKFPIYRCFRYTVGATAYTTPDARILWDGSETDNDRFLVSPVDYWWIDRLVGRDKVDGTVDAFSTIGWINKLKVSDIDGNDDIAALICRSFKAYRFNSSTAYFSADPIEGDTTIKTGRMLEFDARVNDDYKVTFDNLGSVTATVSNVEFTGKIVTGVDKTSEEFTAYEVNSFNFQGALLPGGASNVCSPASSASISPSQLTLTGDSPDVINPSDSFSMSYNGTTNKFAMSGSNNIIFKNYNGNTAYTCKVVLQVLRGGTPVVNLSHDVSDSMESDTNSGSTVHNAYMTLGSAVSQLNLTNPGSDTTASIMSPDPYVPEFGDTVRLTLTLTGNSDSTDYVRMWESTIDCTTAAGSGGLQESTITFTHDKNGEVITNPFVLKLRSSNDIK
jgi:hypothetical protein